MPAWLAELLARMDDEMALRGMSMGTRRLYVAHTRRFYQGGAYEGPEVSNEAVRRWLLHLLASERSHSYVGQAYSALRFLHVRVLGTPGPVAKIPRPKKQKRLPKCLSEPETRRFLAALNFPKHRAIAFVLYSAALRVGEAVRLKTNDVDSDRGLIHVRQGKGRKDRYVMLAPVTGTVLAEYVRVDRPYDWLFPGARRDRHLTARSVQRAVARAGERAGIAKRVTPHILSDRGEARVARGRSRRYV